VGLKRKTVPFVTVDEKRELPFTRDLELASLFTLAEARRDGEPLSAMARVYYPLHIHRWEGGVLLIDLLGLNHTSIRYNVIPDVDAFERALEAAADDPDALREALKKADLFKGFAGRKTVRIDGLIVQPKSEELSEFLGSASDFKAWDEAVVFKPVLKSGDIESIISSINSLRGAIKSDLKSLERAKSCLRDALGVSKKVVNEEIQNIRDRSAKVKARMKKELERTRERLRRALERDLNRIKKDYKRQVTPLRGERTKLRRKLSRLRKRSARGAVRDDPKAAEELSKEIEGLEAKLREVDAAIRSLEAWRDSEVEKARAQYKADLKSEADKIKAEEARSREEVLEQRERVSKLTAAVKGVASRIDTLIRSKRGKLRSLSRLCLDVEAETADLYIPFYVFQYGDKKFSLYPPAVASGAKGILSRFKRMFADNLQSKMTLLIKPRAAFMEKYLEKAVKALGRKTALTSAYQRAGDRLNLLRSREAVDKIMMGLVKIRREGWISDGEYIRLQEVLVENLGLISQP